MKKRIFLAFFTLCFLIALCAMPVGAETTEVASGTCGTNLTWTLDSEGTLTISGEGEMDNFICSLTDESTTVPWWEFRDAIIKVVIGNEVANIGESAFAHSTNLNEVSIGNGVSVIGKFAFMNCTALTDLVIPDNTTSIDEFAFSQSGLVSVTLGDGLSEINGCAFSLCKNLKDVLFSNSITYIGIGAFEHCTSLERIVLPTHLTFINHSTFYSCSALKEITLPNGLTGIWDSAFENCSSLASIVIPDSVTVIGEGAFRNCTGLTTMTVGGGVTEICNEAFGYCSGLTSITFMGDAPTFYGLTFQDTVTNLYYPGSNDTWPYAMSWDYGGTITWVPIEKLVARGSCGENLTWTLTDDGLTISGTGDMENYASSSSVPWYDYRELVFNVVICEGVTSIGDRAFYSCKNMASISIPDGITSIGEAAFNNCKSLEGISLPEGIVSIGASAFGSCTGLTKIVLPSSLTSIGDWAFSSCSALHEITIPKNVGSIGNLTFVECTSLSFITVDADNAYYSSDDRGVLFNKGKTVLIKAPDLLSGEYVIPESVSSILQCAFLLCSDLESVSIPNGVTSIEPNTFANCSSLVSITIPGSVTSIKYCAFFGCTGLTDVTIADGVTTIGLEAFALCENLTSIVLPDSVTNMEMSVFRTCSNLKEATLSANLSIIPNGTFVNCINLERITIPACVTSIENNAFGFCFALKEIHFAGDAPAIGGAFGLVTATAYYPADNETWTEEVMQNYSGTITWVPYGSEPDYTVTYTNASLSLAGDIGVNYYAELSEDIVADEGAYMQFTIAGETQIVPLSNAIYDADNGTYRFSCKVAAKQMTENIVGQMYLSDGTAVGEAKVYSVKAYCDAAIPVYGQYAAYADLVDLMEAMLNYGGYSQVQFGYNTANLANADLADTSLPAITADDVAAYAHGATGSEAGISVSSVSLLLESTTIIRFYFNVEEGYDISGYTFYVDGVETTPVQSDENMYYVDKVNVAAKDLDEMATVTVGGLTVKYCGLSYVRQVAVLYPTYYSNDLENVAKALYAYNQAANAYFGA